MPPIDTVAIANRYYAAIRARDIAAYAALFHTTALFDLPDGRTLHGKKAIIALMEKVLASEAPVPLPFNYIANAAMLAVEAKVTTSNGQVQRMCSIFEVDAAGLITHLTAYRR